jgi:hypothetical protein
MKTNRYIRLNEDGSSCIVHETIDEVSVTDDIVKELSSEVKRTADSVASIDKIPVSILITNSSKYMMMKLPSIRLDTLFNATTEGCIVPTFIAQSSAMNDDINAAPMWTPPQDMRLMFCSCIEINGDGLFFAPARQQWLIAYDKEKRAYRLPLPNVFDDCSICMGEYTSWGDSMIESFSCAYTQFKKSSWNADLLDAARAAKSKYMFRFKVAGENIEQLPYIAENWTDLSEKIATKATSLFA